MMTTLHVSMFLLCLFLGSVHPSYDFLPYCPDQFSGLAS